ncbi:putative adenosine monophosphate-protein transferase Fic [Dickeya dianthicola]|uniref:putative adenosine monophosphate-protein transferase Fic n=1 Tax=Dickeya dianthicola TaxID=204039 RepID=UPI001F606786|nr:putative adenosine monophosphate-protein transferase Fic [Dickeya dianthicola]MCI4185418.1 putative adenosine monophosphate-protein transferase Fic [Dickeya dianthicola]
MDKYDASNDHYCYPNSFVLKNKLNIDDLSVLEEAEREITSITINSVKYNNPPYNLNYIKQLHKILFSPIYAWAGEIRNVDISKGGTRFCNCSRIEPEANKLFLILGERNWLASLNKDDFCKMLAEFYCEFNMIHPFREGNGRVQRVFFEHLSLSAGYELDWEDVSQNEWIQANIDGVDVKYESMSRIFKRIVKIAH